MRYFKGHGRAVTQFAQDWIQQTKGRWAGEALTLEPWQLDLLDELYLVDENGRYVYREALVGLPRKNGKSTLCAAIALHGLLASGESGAEVYAAAASKDQARVVFDQARDFVEASPRLQSWLTTTKNAIVCKANGGVFRVLPADGPLQHGLNPSLVVIDELWAHRDPELYYALTTGQLARQNPLVVSITTAGHDRESICWQVHEQGKGLGGLEAQREARFLFRWFQGEDGCAVDDPKAWHDANPSSWITDEDLLRESQRLPEFVFRRLHLNQWTAIEDAWINDSAWDSCRGEVVWNPEEPSWIGIDVGVKRDSSAVVACQWHGDKLHVKSDLLLPELNPELGVADVRELVGRKAGEFPGLKEAAFDPWAFRESAEELLDRGVPMVQFDQSPSRMSQASEKLYELVTEKRIVHEGDQDLRTQVLNAVVAPTERGWRISKRKSKARIDGCIALAIAADRAVDGRNAPPPSRVAFL